MANSHLLSNANNHAPSRQTQSSKHRTRHRSHSDPFSDPVYPSKPVPRLPPEPPPKYPQNNRIASSASKQNSPHRDNTIADAVRDTVQVRLVDQSRTRMGRSQMYVLVSSILLRTDSNIYLYRAQNNNSPPTRPGHSGRRSLSQDSVLQTANALDKAKGKIRGKKGSMHADVIDRLDFTGVGPSTSYSAP